MATTSHIARIGVTGGIGSGKTAVCQIFERLGVPVLYADAIAREISDTNTAVKKAIVALLGAGSYENNGALNRPYVASLVFSSKGLQQKLNAIIHPEVEQELDKRYRQMQAGRHPFVIVEAALIYEAGLDKQLDAVVVVDSDEEMRIQRVVQRDGGTAADVRKRIKAQWSQKKKVAQAEFIVYNNGSLRELEMHVQFLYNLFVQRYERV